MNRRSAALALLGAVFLAGAATTLGVQRLAEFRRDAERESAFRTEIRERWGPRSGGERPGGERPDGVRQPPWTELARLRVSTRLSQELGLTEEQTTGIREAFDRHQQDAQQVWDDILPVLASQRDSLEAEIGRILTTEQRQRFMRYLRADRDRLRRDPRFRRGRPPESR